MANKVYKKGKVHPAPLSNLASDDHLSLFLPATILALAASLPLHDRDVLAYFLSCSGSGDGVDLVAARPSAKEQRGRADHAPQFECVCFRCYVSFWSRWNSSPNRHIIDEIIEAFEEQERREKAESQRRVKQGRRGRKEWKKRAGAEDDVLDGGAASQGRAPSETVEAAGEDGSSEVEGGEVGRGLVRRIGTTIGFKIWNFLDRITM